MEEKDEGNEKTKQRLRNPKKKKYIYIVEKNEGKRKSR